MENYKDIIELLIDKNKKGIELLYNIFGKQLYSFAIDKWRFSEDDAYEIIYITFQNLLEKIHKYQFESESHFKNFLYKVFKNNLAERYRKNELLKNKIDFISLDDWMNKHQIEDKSYENIYDFYSESLQNQDSFEISNIYHQFENAFAKISEQEKDILLLKAQEFTYKEIANMLNIDEYNLKVKHHRAKQKLIKIITEEKYEK